MSTSSRLTAAASAAIALLILAGGATARGRVVAIADNAQPPMRRLPAHSRAPGMESRCGAEPTLVSLWAPSPPVVDGDGDGIWSSTTPLTVPLMRGRHGPKTVGEVTLRSLHTDRQIYFMAEWSGDPPLVGQDTVRNQFTLHFGFPEPWPGAADRMCLVACHTAFVNQSGEVTYLAAETIPPGRTASLQAGGGWEAGAWRLEWSRPLIVTNGFDLQFDDLDQTYRFFVKLFEWREGEADPVSGDCVLTFER